MDALTFPHFAEFLALFLTSKFTGLRKELRLPLLER
jgi:hypothetical protein